MIGPLTRTVADSALIYDAITGSTPTDAWQAKPLPMTLTQAYGTEPGRLRIGLSTRLGSAHADPETTVALLATAAALRELGHSVTQVKPRFPEVSVAFMAQTAAGVAEEAERAEYPELLEKRTRTLLKLTAALRGRAEWAERAGQAAAEEFATAFFGEFDLLLMPTTPTPAVPIGQLDGLGAVAATAKATKASSLTSLWNVLGNPAAAIPSGFSDDGLPLSVQLVGPPDGEPAIIQVSAQLERARPWAQNHPTLS